MLIDALDSVVTEVVEVTAAGTSIVFCAKPTHETKSITKTTIILMLFEEVVFASVFISLLLLCLYMTNLGQHHSHEK